MERNLLEGILKNKTELDVTFLAQKNSTIRLNPANLIAYDKDHYLIRGQTSSRETTYLIPKSLLFSFKLLEEFVPEENREDQRVRELTPMERNRVYEIVSGIDSEGIRYLIKQRGLSITRFANIIGVDPSTVTRWKQHGRVIQKRPRESIVDEFGSIILQDPYFEKYLPHQEEGKDRK